VGLTSPFRRRRKAELDPPEFGPASDPTEAYGSAAAMPEETETIPPVASSEPTEVMEPVEIPFDSPRSGRGWAGRLTPIGVFAVAFAFLLAAVVAVGFAQFTSSGIAPWLSISCSAGAVVFTVAALVMTREQ
jgi:hypothetical protein